MLRGPGEEGCAAGARGAAFRLPDTRVPLRFGEGEHRLIGRVTLPDGTPPFPGSPPGPPPDLGPPPPVGLPWSRRAAWRVATRPLSLGDGPLYDALPNP